MSELLESTDPLGAVIFLSALLGIICLLSVGSIMIVTPEMVLEDPGEVVAVAITGGWSFGGAIGLAIGALYGFRSAPSIADQLDDRRPDHEA